MHLQSVIILCSAAFVIGKAVKLDDGRYRPSKYVIYNSGKYDRPAGEGKYDRPADEGKYTYIYKQYIDHITPYIHKMGPGDGKYNHKIVRAMDKYLSRDEKDFMNRASPYCTCDDSRASNFSGLQYLPPRPNRKARVDAHYTVTDIPYEQNDNVNGAENNGNIVLIYGQKEQKSATSSKKPGLQNTGSQQNNDDKITTTEFAEVEPATTSNSGIASFSETGSANVPLSLDIELPLQNQHTISEPFVRSDEVGNNVEMTETRLEIAKALSEIAYAERNTNAESQAATEESSTVQAFDQTTETSSTSDQSETTLKSNPSVQTRTKSVLTSGRSKATEEVLTEDTSNIIDVGTDTGLKKFKVVKIMVFISTIDEL